MATMIQSKYHWNGERYQWERVDRVQYYRGHEICTVSTHDEGWHVKHRVYVVTFPSGKQTYFGIDKRGGNIANLKKWIDANIEKNGGNGTREAKEAN